MIVILTHAIVLVIGAALTGLWANATLARLEAEHEALQTEYDYLALVIDGGTKV